MLGTFEVREFAKSLDMERHIKSSVSNVENLILTLKRDKIQFLINLKRSLDQTKELLLNQGHSNEELTIGAVMDKQKKAEVTFFCLTKPTKEQPIHQ